MRLYQKIITGGLVIAGLAGLIGCKDNSNQESQRNEPAPSHFATVPMVYETGMSITSGDFDGDGDLDLIVGAKYPGKNEGRVYRFNNDGKGNLSQ